MDLNEFAMEGLPLTQLPLGFGMALAMNEAAMSSYAGLSESEKEQLIMRCKDARSKEEMQKVVDNAFPGIGVEALMAETEEASRMRRATGAAF